MRRPIPVWIGLVLLCGLEGCGQSSPIATANGGSTANSTQSDAIRFLEQSSFGPTPATIQAVMQQGIPAYLQAQFAATATNDDGLPGSNPDASIGCLGQPVTSICYRDKYTAFPLEVRFYQNALTEPDQLRQRVALALSEIWVVSANSLTSTYALATYNQILLDDAFGNYRDLMQQITLSPAMGTYQNVVNNARASGDQRPNENYARELMQIFTIGVNQIDSSGQPVTSGGKPVPNYDQSVIEAMARVFTGYTYAAQSGAKPSTFNNTPYYNAPMVPVESLHDTGSKSIVNGQLLPSGQTAEQDVAAALDAIFKHPNIGPYVSRLLIQNLVTANPSPAYVQRVAAVFANDGQGVRGDLKAVVQAILLDSEARGAVKTDPSYGKLREPAVILPAILRGVGGSSDGVYLQQQAQAMGEDLFDAPSGVQLLLAHLPAAGHRAGGPGLRHLQHRRRLHPYQCGARPALRPHRARHQRLRLRRHRCRLELLDHAGRHRRRRPGRPDQHGVLPRSHEQRHAAGAHLRHRRPARHRHPAARRQRPVPGPDLGRVPGGALT